MRSQVRYSLLALIAVAIVAVSAPAAQAAFGAEKFFAGNCLEATDCTEATLPAKLFTQAAGHPPIGVTDFTLNELGTAGNGARTIRTDLPPGIATNPQALPLCTLAAFELNSGPGAEKNEPSHCGKDTEVGEQKLRIVIPGPTIIPLTGKQYNLEPAKGLPLEFGIDIDATALGLGHLHSFLEGGVSWHKEAEPEEEGIPSGDYHEFFKIKVPRSIEPNTEPGKESPGGEAPLVSSRLVTNGNLGKGLLTNPSTCIGPQTTHLWLEPWAGAPVHTSFTNSVGTENCTGLLAPPFAPTLALTPSTTQSDQPSGITVDLNIPQQEKASETESSDLLASTTTLPEGLTLNPAAAHGLEGCTPEQIAIGSANKVSCPQRSSVGTAVLDVPGLPPGSLTGNVFLGKPATGPITGPPYTIYLDMESERYGQAVRLKGSVMPDPKTGRVTTTFPDNPEGPFRNFKLKFNGGAFANLANPLACGAAKTEIALTPFTGTPTQTPFSQFTVDSNGEGGGCPSTPPFSPAQSSSVEPAQGGAGSTFTLNLERADGQQYISKLRNVLPPGLVGIIPSVTQCGEPQASAGTCTSASQIGTVTVSAGAGSEPFNFPGKVYLTGPFEGAPYGLSIVVPSIAGPFNLGNVIARAKIEVDPHTAQVIATDNAVPSIVGGIPIRMKSLSITLSRQGFERNPTNCGVLATQSTLTGSLGTTANVSTPFQAEGCSSLAFKPTFAVSTSGKPSKANGASLVTTITQGAGQANFKSVLVTLPKQLPSRLTTLQKACLEATFAANPLSCPAGSNVGTATAVTPVLPGKMTGPAYLVSHGGAAFPDLDIVLEGNGVRIILVGNTDIKKGITTTSFAATPDAPFSSFTLNLPTGPHSALAANGNLCKPTLVMPTTMTAQNGKAVKQNTKITPTGCGVQIVGHKVVGKTAYVTVKTFAPGRISASGSGMSTARRTLNNATNAATLKISLSRRAQSRHRPFRTRVRVGFVPKKKGAHSTTSVVVRFR
jgi:hypothetical protein